MPGAHIHQHTLGDGLVPLINRLQDIFSQAGVEALGGISSFRKSPSSARSRAASPPCSRRSSAVTSFLAARKICTRRPLVLQLVHTPFHHSNHRNPAPAEWGEFLHRPGEIFTDFEAIREEIRRVRDQPLGRQQQARQR